VFIPRIMTKPTGGEEAWNFVAGFPVPGFNRTESLLNEGDVLCDGMFFKDTIGRRTELEGQTYYIDTAGKVVDMEGSDSYENRYQRLVGLPWERATPLHNSRNARLGYLKYRTSPVNVAYVRENEMPVENRLDVDIKRITIEWGQVIGRKFVAGQRMGATHVKLNKEKIRELIDGQYPCRAGEFAQMMDKSMLLATRVENGKGVQSVVTDGFAPFNCVSCYEGHWRTLHFCRIDVDFKANFGIVSVFKAYKRHIGPFVKRSAAVTLGHVRSGKYTGEDEELYYMDEIDYNDKAKLEDEG